MLPGTYWRQSFVLEYFLCQDFAEAHSLASEFFCVIDKIAVVEEHHTAGIIGVSLTGGIGLMNIF